MNERAGGREAQLATSRLVAFSAALAAGAAAIWTLWLHDQRLLDGAPSHLPVIALGVAFAVTELVSVHIESRGEAHAVTFSEIPLVAALLFSTPGEAIAARVVSGIVVLGLVRRQSWHKLGFNVSLFALEVAVAAAVFHALLPAGESPVAPAAWPAMGLALLASQVVDGICVTGAITLYSGWPGARLVRQVLVFGTLSCLANTGAGLAFASSVWDRSYAGLLFVGVVVILYLLYRAHMALTERHKSLETLHDFTRALAGSLDLGQSGRAVVEGARRILRGEQSALLLPPVRADGPAVRIVAGEGRVERTTIDPDTLVEDLAVLLPAGTPRLYAPGDPLPGWLAQIGVKDAAIVPLQIGGEPGALLVANRLTEVSEFVEDDLHVFETLASHAAVALERARLVATLEHDRDRQAHLALHDPVTGLPNRTKLLQDLEVALATARDREHGIGLIVVDLDIFKEVHDTLGRETGERLIAAVAERIRHVIPAAAVEAQLAGDQLAVLVPRVYELQEAVDVAEQVAEAFETSFTVDTVTLVIGAALGVAAFPDHAPTPERLVQRAEAAAVVARNEGSGMEVYAPDRDPFGPRRLAIAADLREALAEGDVEVHLQPKMQLADGVVVGAEALVRWTHPRLGSLRPDQFIPSAERTGVIRPLTMYVVRAALAECRAWRDARLDMSVAVNLSARNLFDPRLVDDIAQAIEEAGLPPSALTLELTESTVMSESRRSLAALEGLHEIGVGLSVDDFGTGYSSLTHLRRLPVTELKVDKSFVQTMTTNEPDAVIVRALIDLGRSLGLRTVAEGVEGREAWDLLRDMGCEQAQGYLISRPLPPDQLRAWLGRQTVRTLEGADVVPLRERRTGP